MQTTNAPQTSEDVLKRECLIIQAYRNWLQKHNLRLSSNLEGESPCVIGLALSGGGIRSATFHLGVIQALTEKGLLPAIDYISAVSGGGYIASWLCQWLRETSLPHVIDALSDPVAGAKEDRLQQLRRNTSYLTPKLGLFGHDTLLLFTTYIHQLFLSTIILVLLASAIILYPRIILLAAIKSYHSDVAMRLVAVAGAVSALTSLSLIAVYLRRARTFSKALPGNTASRRLMIICLTGLLVIVSFLYLVWQTHIFPQIPFLLSIALSLLLTFIVNSYWEQHLGSLSPRQKTKVPDRQRICVWLGFISSFCIVLTIYRYAPITLRHSRPLFQQLSSTLSFSATGVKVMACVLSAACIVLMLLLKQNVVARLTGARPTVKFFTAAALSLVLAWYVTYRLGDLAFHLNDLKCSVASGQGAIWIPHLISLIVPLCIVVGCLLFYLLIAILSRLLFPQVRENVMRMIALTYRLTLFWTLTSILSFYGPVIIYRFESIEHIFVSVWLVSICVCLIVGHRRGISSIKNETVRGIVTQCSFVLFITGAWLLVSWLVSRYLLDVRWRDASFSAGWDFYWSQIDATQALPLLGLMTGALLLLVSLSSRIGINSSSMHLFYQGRLANAYLDETLPNSRSGKNPTTLDKLRPHKRGYKGPYLLLNAALNLGSAEDLAWQERLATNFVFSPEFCGYTRPRVGPNPEATAYRRTSEFEYGGHSSIRLAQAMSISGSALGTNMGCHTSWRTRLLYMIFNLRLGWWLANPKFANAWQENLPRARVSLLWDEILGHTHDHGPYVLLSDGGHFENLGIYELIRRRCRVIIASDASSDPQMSCEHLARAVSKIRADFGVEVAISATSEKMREGIVLGEILYDRDSKNDKNGVFVYIKPTVSGAVPIDVTFFKTICPDFPHEPTINQWFVESQFEAYRVLGLTIARRLTKTLPTAALRGDPCAEFLRLLKKHGA